MEKESNPLLDLLLIRLEEAFSIIGLLNTSLNINGQANCETLEDIFETFFLADLDFIAIDGELLIIF